MMIIINLVLIDYHFYHHQVPFKLKKLLSYNHHFYNSYQFKVFSL